MHRFTDDAMGIDLNGYAQRAAELDPIVCQGVVNKIVGLVIEASGPKTAVGGICDIVPEPGAEPVRAEIVGFDEDKVFLMPLGDLRNVLPGSRIVSLRSRATVKVGQGMLGRVLDGLGRPIDDRGALVLDRERLLYGSPLNPVKRKRITKPLHLGVRCLDALLTLGKGQKLGIFAGSGVGKSVLLGMIAKNTQADVNVIALIGERGREVREFLERDLGEEGMKRSVVIAATSDQSPLARMRGAYLATTIAEYFRSEGKDVLLMMDSLTRLAMARREVGISVGEPPSSRGYTPSVFTMMPSILERIGNHDGSGSITGIYTVLVEGDDLNDPVGDAARSILDGHIVLSRDLATRNLYPAVDVLASISRCMPDIIEKRQIKAVGRFRSTLAVYREAEDLINIGAYAKGSNPKIDYAIQMIEPMEDFIRQNVKEKIEFKDSLNELINLFPSEEAGNRHEQEIPNGDGAAPQEEHRREMAT